MECQSTEVQFEPEDWNLSVAVGAGFDSTENPSLIPTARISKGSFRLVFNFLTLWFLLVACFPFRSVAKRSFMTEFRKR